MVWSSGRSVLRLYIISALLVFVCSCRLCNVLVDSYIIVIDKELWVSGTACGLSVESCSVVLVEVAIGWNVLVA